VYVRHPLNGHPRSAASAFLPSSLTVRRDLFLDIGHALTIDVITTALIPLTAISTAFATSSKMRCISRAFRSLLHDISNVNQ
jgi:hypothetical protein